MNPAEIDALVASVQAAKASGQPLPSAEEPNPADYGLAPNFAELAGGISAAEVPLGMLLDLTLPVSIELGRTSMTVQEILRLGRGAVIQLDPLPGEPIDIYVGGRPLPEGRGR